MKISRNAAILAACAMALGFGGSVAVPHCVAQAAQAQSASSRATGTVTAVTSSGLTLKTDAGTEMNVVPGENARMLRTAPGQTTLNGAASIQLSDIQVGDRMLIRGKAGDGKQFTASDLIVMKKADIAGKQARDLEDWQKRGIGGRISAVDTAAGTIKVPSSGAGVAQVVTVHVTPNTVVRRYSPDSVKFNQAAASTLDQIKVGDQMRARGSRSADGAELTAEEIVAGTFRNIAGTVESTDAANHSFTVKDLETKKPVVVKISSESQMRKLSPMMAQMLAMRVKRPGNAGGAAPAGGAMRPGGPGNAGFPGQPAAGMRPGAGPVAGPGNGMNGARGDVNQMLAHLPAVTLGELQKGDAVMVVSTQSGTAITMLSGVEPILTASPNEGMSMLSAFSMGEGGGEGGMGMGAGPE
jgi:co-chaperonin GroES (HSP10)